MDGRPGKTEQLLALASTLVMAWCMLPPHQRQLITMRLLDRARRLTARLAHAEGHRGMADELAGRDPLPRYGGAYALARLHDALGRALERVRP